MNYDLKIIKKKFGENMMKLSRELFPTLLEEKGLLSGIFLDNFNPSKMLYDDIKKEHLEKEFKMFIYGFLNKDEVIENSKKTPKELFEEIGYDFYECETEEDIKKFKKYYARGEELCTFNDKRLDKCYIFFVVKKNVDEIKREKFKNPIREDEYGTSVMSIQFTRDETHTLSIKNRYNHALLEGNPDATYRNNLENIAPGLTKSFENIYGLKQFNPSVNFEMKNYVRGKDGKFYKKKEGMKRMSKKILVTGCNGQLVRAINKEYAGSDVTFINTDVAEGEGVTALDITKIEQVLSLVRAEQPEVIINCAAHTNVDACEKQWDAAYRINALGPRNLSIAAEAVGAKMIHVSTDYVFEGNGTKPYTEFDAPNPVSAYGKTKLEGEKFVQQFSNHFFIFRTAWLYGDGKNFVKTMLNLSETHDEVSVVCDQLGSPTSAVELAKAIHHFEGTENYGLYHATCEGDTNWADFTEEIFKRAGKSTKVNHVTSKQYKQMNPAAADRPAYSILDNYMMRLADGYQMADWKDALDVYMAELK